MIIKRLLQKITASQMDNLEESDKLLETYNLPKLNLEKTGNMNRWITSIENEPVI